MSPLSFGRVDPLRKCPPGAAPAPLSFSPGAAPAPLSFSPAIGRTPSLAAVLERLYATAYEALGEEDYDKAQKLFAAMAVAAPRDERCWTGLALAREASGDFRGAASLYEIGIALAPTATRCHLGRARAMKELGRHDQADRSLDAADASTADPMLLAEIAEERMKP